MDPFLTHLQIREYSGFARTPVGQGGSIGGSNRIKSGSRWVKWVAGGSYYAATITGP
jgi:hypothetical protein